MVLNIFLKGAIPFFIIWISYGEHMFFHFLKGNNVKVVVLGHNAVNGNGFKQQFNAKSLSPEIDSGCNFTENKKHRNAMFRCFSWRALRSSNP